MMVSAMLSWPMGQHSKRPTTLDSSVYNGLPQKHDFTADDDCF